MTSTTQTKHAVVLPGRITRVAQKAECATTMESTPDDSTAMESTPDESTAMESTPDESTAMESTPDDKGKLSPRRIMQK